MIRMNSQSPFCVLFTTFFLGTVFLSCRCLSEIDTGDFSAELQKKNLTNIPNNLTANIRYIDASDNFIAEITFDDVKHYKHVIYLKLSHNLIDILEDIQGISELTKLQHLDLSNNRIRNLQLAVFKENFHLQTLIFDKNPIEAIEKDLFCTENIENISLKNCNIFVINWEALGECSNLKSLDLTGNRVERIREEDLLYLPKLKHLYVEGNPLISVDPSVRAKFHIRYEEKTVLRKSEQNFLTSHNKTGLGTKTANDIQNGSSEESLTNPHKIAVRNLSIEQKNDGPSIREGTLNFPAEEAVGIKSSRLNWIGIVVTALVVVTTILSVAAIAYWYQKRLRNQEENEIHVPSSPLPFHNEAVFDEQFEVLLVPDEKQA